MTAIIGRGVVSPAETKNIVKDLFQNEKIKYTGEDKIYTFSRLLLTETQQGLLSYPSGFAPKNYFIIYQIDVIDTTGVITSTQLKMVSFIEKTIGDGFVYGYYFDIFVAEPDPYRYEIDHLEDSHYPIELISTATFTPMNYMEVYNDIRGETVILGLEMGEVSRASLQYAHDDRYYLEDLLMTGIDDPSMPKIKLTGLSKNLR